MSPECNPRFFPHQDNSDVQNLSIPLLNIAVLTYFSATQNHLLDFLSDAYFPETATISGWAETVGWVYKEIYLLIEPLRSIPERPQASKRAKTVLRMTKMTLRSKKMIEMIRIDKQAPFLDWSPCQRMKPEVRLDMIIFSKNLGFTMTQNRPKNVKKLTIHTKHSFAPALLLPCF